MSLIWAWVLDIFSGASHTISSLPSSQAYVVFVACAHWYLQVHEALATLGWHVYVKGKDLHKQNKNYKI